MMSSSGRLLVLVAAPALLLLLLLPQLSAEDLSAVERSKREPGPVAAAGKSADPAGKSADPVGKAPVVAATNKPPGKGAKKAGQSGKNKKSGGKNAAAGKKQNGKKAAKSAKGKKSTAGKKDNKGAKKGKKGAKKGKTSAKKGKKGAKKSNKKNGKGSKKKSAKSGKKKNAKSGKKKSAKSGKKKSGKGKKQKSGGAGFVRVQNDSCVTDLVAILGAYGTSYSTAFRQASRIKKNAEGVGKKGVKSGDFKDTADTLLNALGGNRTSPTCGGTKTNMSSSVEYSNLTTLSACNTTVLTQCGNNNVPALVDTCNATVQAFNLAAQPIIKQNQTADQICAAVAGFNKALIPQIQACVNNMTSIDKDVGNRKKNCSDAFVACRGAQRNSIPFVYNCKPGPGGVANKDDAKAQLAAAGAVRNAAANLENKVVDALTAAGAATGPGSDGSLPATGRASRLRRQAPSDPQTCLNVMNGMQAANQSAANTAANAVAPLDPSTADAATSKMNSVATSPTLNSDLASCTKDTSARATVIIAIVRIRIYVFWIRNWRVTVIEIKITLIIISFPELPNPTTVSVKPTATIAATTPTASASASTKAPTGLRRERIFQLFNNKVQLH